MALPAQWHAEAFSGRIVHTSGAPSGRRGRPTWRRPAVLWPTHVKLKSAPQFKFVLRFLPHQRDTLEDIDVTLYDTLTFCNTLVLLLALYTAVGEACSARATARHGRQVGPWLRAAAALLQHGSVPAGAVYMSCYRFDVSVTILQHIFFTHEMTMFRAGAAAQFSKMACSALSMPTANMTCVITHFVHCKCSPLSIHAVTGGRADVGAAGECAADWLCARTADSAAQAAAPPRRQHQQSQHECNSSCRGWRPFRSCSRACRRCVYVLMLLRRQAAPKTRDDADLMHFIAVEQVACVCLLAAFCCAALTHHGTAGSVACRGLFRAHSAHQWSTIRQAGPANPAPPRRSLAHTLP
jgi:hypothetical protein